VPVAVEPPGPDEDDRRSRDRHDDKRGDARGRAAVPCFRNRQEAKKQIFRSEPLAPVDSCEHEYATNAARNAMGAFMLLRI